MRDIHIAIIDDGVNEGYYDSLYLEQNIIITENLEAVDRHGYDRCKFSHGTVCAGIIKKYCSNAKISSIKVLNDNMQGNIERLIYAIKWCMDKDVDIINLSIGTVHSKDKKPLKKIADKASDKSLIIVAAKSNEDIATYPACFHNVLGIKSDKSNMLKEGQLSCNFQSADGIEITACGRHRLVNYLGEEKTTSNWNSYAAPMISAIIAGIMADHENLSLAKIKEKLLDKAVK